MATQEQNPEKTMPAPAGQGKTIDEFMHERHEAAKIILQTLQQFAEDNPQWQINGVRLYHVTNVVGVNIPAACSLDLEIV